jgi:hypothetical protein
MSAIRIRISEEDLKDINPDSPLYKNATRELEEQKKGDAYRRYAEDRLHRDGHVEFDDDAVVSLGFDGGAYVMGWVWVDAIELIEEGYLDEPEEKEAD